MSAQQLQGDGFSIDIEERGGYLRALVRGAVDSAQVSVGYWTALGAECRRRELRSALVLEDLPPWPDAPAEVFEAVTDAMVAAGFRDIRVAFVDLNEEVQANEYGLIVGNEKGLNMMMFSNESYAARWLRFGSPDRGDEPPR